MTDSVAQRYNARADDYSRWWAPVLIEAAQRVVDYVEWYAGKPPADHATVLELGTGTGSLARAALTRWPTVELIASDVATAMLDVARAELADVDAERVRFVEASAAAVPLPDASVDLIISSFVLQLVPDRLAVLREAHRLLRPGGVIAYVTWIARDEEDGFEPSIEFDEAVLDLEVEEPSDPPCRHAGDVSSAPAAARQMRRAGLRNVIARDDELAYDWTLDSYLDYKLAYDETALIAMLTDAKRADLESGARDRLSRLPAEAFHWRPPIVYVAGRKSP